MPFIDTKVSIRISSEQEKELKQRLGEAISILPGKSESWLMLNFSDEQKMYFKGEDEEPTAFVAVSVYGEPNSAAFEELTAELSKIYGEVLGVAPDHLYVKYATTRDWGWNGRNF